MKLRHRLKLTKRTLLFGGVYVTLVVLMFAVVTLQQRDSMVAVPAMARRAERAAPRFTVFQYLFSLQPDIPKSALRAGLPLIAFVEDIESSRKAPETFIAALGLFFTGVDPDDPRTFLDAQIPGLALYGVGRAPGTPASAIVRPAEITDAIIRLPGASTRQPVPEIVASRDPLVLVYHTHATESYLPELGPSRALRPDDAFSLDSEINMTRVGRELVRELQQRGVPAIHSPAVHDLEGRLGSYIRSADTIQAILKQYPTVKILLDVHRDAALRPQTTALVRGQLMARIMIVLGKDNADWQKNYDFAVAFIDRLEAAYPGLSLGIYPKPGRFNQHYSPFGLLLEMGGVENSLEESLRSARAAADALAQLVRAESIR